MIFKNDRDPYRGLKIIVGNSI